MNKEANRASDPPITINVMSGPKSLEQGSFEGDMGQGFWAVCFGSVVRAQSSANAQAT